MRKLHLIAALTLSCLLLPAAQAQSNVLIGLKHRYSFSNAAGALANGTQITDSIGTAHGFIRGTGASATGSGVRLTGGSSASAAYIDLPNASVSGSAEVFPGYDEATYEAWVTVHSSQSWSRILDFGNNAIDEVASPGGSFNGADYLMVSANIGTANDIRFERGGQFLTGGGTQDIAGATTLGAQMHIVVTYDTASSAWKLYKNGTQIASVPTLLGPSTIDDLNVWLGRSNWSADNNSDVTYDELRIYNYALNAQEVLNNYSAGPNTITVTAPGVPVDLSATPGPNQVSLTWTASAGATKYYVKRATASGGPYSTVGSPISASYVDASLVGGTTYYYIVSAVKSGLESAASTEVSAMPASSEIVAGSVIGSAGSWGDLGNTIDKVFDGNLATFYDAVNGFGDWVGLDLGSNTTITLIRYCPRDSWNARMVGGVFQACNVSNFSSGVVTLHTIGSAPAYGVLTPQSITNAGAYRYVRYLGPADGYCNVAELEFYKSSVVPPPAMPTGLAATPGYNQVGLSWNASAGATGYNVKRATTSGGPYNTIMSPITTNYTDASAIAGTTNYYVVSAVNSGGESTNTVEVSAMPLTPPPGTPVNLIAVAGDGEVGLSWNSTFGATSYNVKRSNTNGGPYSIIGSPATTTYTDATALNGATYYYVVSAANTGGESTNSTQVIATPTSTSPVNVSISLSNGVVTLTWPADHTGWRLQTQTNGLGGTNWFAVAGAAQTNRLVVPMISGDGSVFFRLVYP